jgi:putative hydrolase of the HAD superfamily
MDRDLLDTALRECLEESGVERHRRHAVCALPDRTAGRVTGAHTRVRPWLVRADDAQEPQDGDGEMVDWRWFRLRDLDDPALRTTVSPAPGLELPGLRLRDGILWGMTLGLLEDLWRQPILARSHWLLDYDGTLYPASHRLTDAVDRRITDWVASARGIEVAEADELRKRLYRDHGNTLRGMMREDDVDPNAYLDFVFDLPQDHMPAADGDLVTFLEGLPRPAAIFTNARADYVRRGLAAMGIRTESVGAIHDIESFAWRAKPEPGLYAEVLLRERTPSEDVAFVDDRSENLEPARRSGMLAILVDEAGHHAWLESAASSEEPAEEGPYHAKIERVGDLMWLTRPRLGVPERSLDP